MATHIVVVNRIVNIFNPSLIGHYYTVSWHSAVRPQFSNTLALVLPFYIPYDILGMRVSWIYMCIMCHWSFPMISWPYLCIALEISQLITRKHGSRLFYVLKRGFYSTLKKTCHFCTVLPLHFKNTSFGHIVESLSETFHPSKTIVELIRIIQTYFESPCNVMEPNTCIILSSIS